DWDGEQLAPEICNKCGKSPCVCTGRPPKLCPVCGQKPCVCEKDPPEICQNCGKVPCECRKKTIIMLADGKEREIQHMVQTSYWSADGKPMSAEEFLKGLFGELPKFFKNEEELRKIWSDPITRKALLSKLADAGYGKAELTMLQSLISAEKSDLFDVLEYVSYAIKPLTREDRVENAHTKIYKGLNEQQQEFISFVLTKYVETGVEELDQEKLPDLLNLKYQSLSDATTILGGVDRIKQTFISFQKYLYEKEMKGV
ncbi:MAG: restriction endonuclease subunit R, partial [Candidatus Firestonebacteria bacterium]|nr:restriction endonuclease subunit R [Candidatus Firestonebacteria bacterium]